MPLGHTAMILMEKILGHDYVFKAALFLGIAGSAVMIYGYKCKNNTIATISGLFAGLFIWTGWIEFAHVYVAHTLNVPPLMEANEIVTKPEYLIMPASAGFLCFFLIYFLFKTDTGCNFYITLQRFFKIKGLSNKTPAVKNNYAIITSVEIIMILWTFYLLLLFTYDIKFFGDKHFVTHLIAYGSLLWSAYLFVKLLKIDNLGRAIRYAIPTVIIFWNFVEILGRWNLFKEIWIHPNEHWLEVTFILIVFLVILSYTMIGFTKRNKTV